MDRKELKRTRIRLMNEIDIIGQRHNYHCETAGCPDCERLADIGVMLDGLSRSTFRPPAELTWSAYLIMREKDWTKKDIFKHYRIGAQTLEDFIEAHQNKSSEEIDLVAINEKMNTPELTVNLIKDLKAQGKTDADIIKLTRTNIAKYYKFKRENGLMERKQSQVTEEKPQENAAKPQTNETQKSEPEQPESENALTDAVEAVSGDTKAEQKARERDEGEGLKKLQFQLDMTEEANRNLQAELADARKTENTLRNDLVGANDERDYHISRAKEAETAAASIAAEKDELAKRLQDEQLKAKRQEELLREQRDELHYQEALLLDKSYEIERMNKLLERQYRDEKFTVELMKRYTDLHDRVSGNG